MNLLTDTHNVDPISFCVVRLDVMCRSDLLSKATGFFYCARMNGKEKVYFLVTNWHVVAGRHTDPPYKCLNNKLAIPTHLVTKFTLKPQNPGVIQQQEITIHLHNSDGDALWIQHPGGPGYDVAAVSLGTMDEYIAEGMDVLANRYDMKIEIGNDVFILGYPLGFSHFLDTPIWKKGIIASEPHVETSTQHSKIIIDATTRSGMSGSPVIMREKTHYVAESGEIKAHPNASRFIGIYSSRPTISDSDQALNDAQTERAEIGYVLKSGAIQEMLTAQRRGHSLHEIPVSQESGNN